MLNRGMQAKWFDSNAMSIEFMAFCLAFKKMKTLNSIYWSNNIDT